MTSLSLYSHHHLVSQNFNSSRALILYYRCPAKLTISPKFKFTEISKINYSDSVPSDDSISSNFCIIEGPETVQDFVQMQLQEIQDNIRSRRNKIFLLMEEVDPIVASFSGGAVGVISVLMLIEADNVEQQEKKRYLACARCSASGVCFSIDPISLSSATDHPLRVPKTERCQNCYGAGKVMCPTCLCTGMKMANKHDPRIKPFD